MTAALHMPQPDPSSSLPSDLKILHILDHSIPLHSGYSFRTLALVNEQRRLGWQTVHLTTQKHTLDTPEVEEIDGLTFYRCKPLQGLGAAWPGVGEMRMVQSVARRIMEVVEIERPDILHAHSPFLTALAALQARRWLDLPVVYEVRAIWEDAAVSHATTRRGSLRYRLSRFADSIVLARCDAVTTICQGLKTELSGRGIPGDKITLIPNGVDLGAFPLQARERKSDAASRLARQWDLEGRTVLGFAGSFYPYEGLDLLLEALPAVMAEHAEVRVLLVGGGPAEDALREKARALGLDEVVRFVGRVPHSEIPHCNELIDIFVFPRHAERLTEIVTPLKPLEAMASGGIVLASDVGGHRELIRHGETGMLFKADDAAAFSGAILDLLNRPEAWPGLRQRARRFVETERSWARSASGYEAAYLTASSARNRPGRET